MKSFNIAQVLADAGVNNDTSARKQIEYIPIGQIEADPGNFYDLPKLKELANSISIIGLQEPVVVRPVEDGRYRIISGHRRTAALRILIDRGEHDDKVMCIVERQQESEALTQLKLIMGNSENRVLTSAEQARQVEETQQLIYQLKQEGFDFPGRVRDYVSDICKISTGKIARLKVIRSQLVPGFLNLWEAGKLKDSVAYALAKQPPVRQNAVKHSQMDVPGRDEFPCSEEWLEYIFSAMDKVESDCKQLSCDDTTLGNCDHVAVRVNRAASIGRFGSLPCSRCCKNCFSLQSCSFSCGHADGIKAERKAVEKAANQRAKEEQKERDRPKKDILADVYSRVKELRAEKEISAPDFCKASSGYDCKSEIDALSELESGKVQLTKRLPGGIWPDEAFRLIATADLLGCSIDYLLGRTDVKGVAAAPAAAPEKCVNVDTWHTGNPPDPGEYIVYGFWDGVEACCMATWHDDVWDMDTVYLDSVSAWAYPPHKAVPASDVHAADPGKCVKVDTWHTGYPPEPGWYICRIEVDGVDAPQYHKHWYGGKTWQGLVDDIETVTNWVPVLEEDE